MLLLVDLLLPFFELERDVVGLGSAGVLEGKGLPGLNGHIVQDVHRLDVVFQGDEIGYIPRFVELYIQLIEVGSSLPDSREVQTRRVVLFPGAEGDSDPDVDC